jgi:uncharacterized protein (DUF427 family)
MPEKIPGPDHPISMAPNSRRVVVYVAGQRVADTRNAITLKEAGHEAVQYIPRRDVQMGWLERSDNRTYCPYKGDCSYYSIPIGGQKAENAVWAYEHPYKAVQKIADYVAFDPKKVDSIQEDAAA